MDEGPTNVRFAPKTMRAELASNAPVELRIGFDYKWFGLTPVGSQARCSETIVLPK